MTTRDAEDVGRPDVITPSNTTPTQPERHARPAPRRRRPAVVVVQGRPVRADVPPPAGVRAPAGRLPRSPDRMTAPGPPEENEAIPSGYTYLGQFIDHDITFDPVSSLQRQNDPDALHNFRTPRFDLDSRLRPRARRPALPLRRADGDSSGSARTSASVPGGSGARAGPAAQQPRRERRRRELLRGARADRRPAQRREPASSPSCTARCCGSTTQWSTTSAPTSPLDRATTCSRRPSGWSAGTTSGSSCTTSCRGSCGEDVVDDILRVEEFVVGGHGRPPIALLRPRFALLRAQQRRRTCRSSSPWRPTASATR